MYLHGYMCSGKLRVLKVDPNEIVGVISRNYSLTQPPFDRGKNKQTFYRNKTGGRSFRTFEVEDTVDSR